MHSQGRWKQASVFWLKNIHNRKKHSRPSYTSNKAGEKAQADVLRGVA